MFVTIRPPARGLQMTNFETNFFLNGWLSKHKYTDMVLMQKSMFIRKVFQQAFHFLQRYCRCVNVLQNAVGRECIDIWYVTPQQRFSLKYNTGVAFCFYIMDLPGDRWLQPFWGRVKGCCWLACIIIGPKWR